MDFIAIDLDKHDVWAAFMEPQLIYAEMVEPHKLSPSPYLKLAQTGCVVTAEYGCIATDNRLPVNGFTFNSSLTGGPTSNVFMPGTMPTEEFATAAQDNETTTVTEQQRCIVEQASEADIDDAAAQAAARDIMNRSDWRRREYGAFIYSGPNGIRLGEMFRGDSDSVDLIARPGPGESIVGRVHSHPRGGIGAPSDIDIDGVNQLISIGMVDGDNFSDYILDGNRRNADTNLSEFDEPQNGAEESPNNDTRADARGDCSNV